MPMIKKTPVVSLTTRIHHAYEVDLIPLPDFEGTEPACPLIADEPEMVFE